MLTLHDMRHINHIVLLKYIKSRYIGVVEKPQPTGKQCVSLVHIHAKYTCHMSSYFISIPWTYSYMLLKRENFMFAQLVY